MYLYLALFWLGVGIIFQVFWDGISEFAHIPVSRLIVALFCFVLVSYNFTRWRIYHMMIKTNRKLDEPKPYARRERAEYDPNLDFTKQSDESAKPKPND